ncbi:phage terminase large subunit [Methylobacterium sp. CCH5-D2]|uniref:phage terminase large subunit n=1 Tax=Methylobacterium sp. CCH5-D2 TaxID=1768765 RepID=UPI000ADF0B1C|nr:phage terminase large subunit [Methylobacterium sp. CCH5-D2]
MSNWLADPRATLKELDRVDCLESQLRFTAKFFREKEQAEFLVGAHHRVIADTLDRVIRGEIPRLIINIPPGYTKTEMAVVHFVARGLAWNPRARFIHASFNGPLALFNSNSVRDVVALEGYQEHWPVKIRDDVAAKELWRTTEGGGMKASHAAGPITGFRAGRMEPGFTGALIIDDPVKPDDAESEIERTKVNNRWHSTFKSRLAHEDVPVIVIMQRLHVDDFSGFLLKGGAGCRWHHLLLPVEIDNAALYPAEYTHGDPIPHGLPDGPLWAAKHTGEQIVLLKTNPYVFAGQYGQVPTVAGGNLFKAEWLTPYTVLPPLAYRVIYVDTAQKTSERNDYSVFQCWGMGKDGKAYLLDQIRGRFEAPDLEKTARLFWAKHRAADHTIFGALRAMKIEDKSSGTGLIQSLGRLPVDPAMAQVVVPVVGIPREKDKVMRANDALPSFAAGLVRIPAEGPETAWIAGWRGEMLAFPNGAHDDQVDPTMDAVNEMVGGAGSAAEQMMRAFG